MNQGSVLAQKFIESTRGMAVEKRYNVGLLRTTGFTVKALEYFVLLHLDLNATAKVGHPAMSCFFYRLVRSRMHNRHPSYPGVRGAVRSSQKSQDP